MQALLVGVLLFVAITSWQLQRALGDLIRACRARNVIDGKLAEAADRFAAGATAQAVAFEAFAGRIEHALGSGPKRQTAPIAIVRGNGPVES